MENQEPRFRKVEAKKSKMHPGGLADWVQNEKWVDLRRKNKKGKFEPCGRNDTSKGQKPVCVPINKAKNLTEKQIKNRKRQKARKEKEPNPGKKPNTTKYTEQAGGKSNVSNNNNIRFIGSMIPLSELRPTQYNLSKFIKISGIEDEGGLVDDSEMPMGVNPFDNHIEDSNKRIKNIKEHDAIEYVASVYKDLMFVLTQSLLPEQFEEVTTFNLDDLKKNIDYDKFVNMAFQRLLELEEDPYDQQLNLVLDEMKKASQQFNIFQWKTHYERLLVIVMTGIIKFEISMMENMRKDKS
jgi:hypothetical protein